jgi:hypothetical protein
MMPGYVIHPDFFPEAEALRAAFEEHFARPEQHRSETHHVWNYWYVPEQYTYLRTTPERLFPAELIRRFSSHLERFARETYGFTKVYHPYVSLYVAGCRQGLHNDAKNGRLGYVYSITRWDERNFQGGETVIMSEREYFNSERMLEAQAGTSLHALVPGVFNQMLVFDDRLPHAVQRIEGTMEPTRGRVVLHGHFVEGPPHVEGHLAPAQVDQTLQQIRDDLAAVIGEAGRGLAGAVNLRLNIGPDGAVQSVTKLFDRLMQFGRDAANPDEATAAVEDFFRALQFPAAQGESRLTLSAPFGARLG